jgi:CDP-diacylglycerol pyrophosphatase
MIWSKILTGGISINTKKIKMKIIFVLASLIASVAMYAQSDFSGKWKLNLDRSEFNETPGAPAAPKLVVEQKAGMITLHQ